MDTPNFQGTHLWNRLVWAKENLLKRQPKYCVVWEDPDDLDQPMKITTPDPNWLAAALNGGVLPKVERYNEIVFGCFEGNDPEPKATYVGIHSERNAAKWCTLGEDRSYRIVDYSSIHGSEPEGPLTEEEALEYIVQKDVPQHVWAERRNRQTFRIVPRSSIPKDRTDRNAWRLNNFTKMEAV